MTIDSSIYMAWYYQATSHYRDQCWGWRHIGKFNPNHRHYFHFVWSRDRYREVMEPFQMLVFGKDQFSPLVCWFSGTPGDPQVWSIPCLFADQSNNSYRYPWQPEIGEIRVLGGGRMGVGGCYCLQLEWWFIVYPIQYAHGFVVLCEWGLMFFVKIVYTINL